MHARFLHVILERCDFATFRALLAIGPYAGAVQAWAAAGARWYPYADLAHPDKFGDLAFVQWLIDVAGGGLGRAGNDIARDWSWCMLEECIKATGDPVRLIFNHDMNNFEDDDDSDITHIRE